MLVWLSLVSVVIRSLAGRGGVRGFLDGICLAHWGRRDLSVWISMARCRGTDLLDGSLALRDRLNAAPRWRGVPREGRGGDGAWQTVHGEGMIHAG